MTDDRSAKRQTNRDRIARERARARSVKRGSRTPEGYRVRDKELARSRRWRLKCG